MCTAVHRAASPQLPTPNYQLPRNSQRPTPNFQLPTANSQAVCALGIGGWKLVGSWALAVGSSAASARRRSRRLGPRRAVPDTDADDHVVLRELVDDIHAGDHVAEDGVLPVEVRLRRVGAARGRTPRRAQRREQRTARQGGRPAPARESAGARPGKEISEGKPLSTARAAACRPRHGRGRSRRPA